GAGHLILGLTDNLRSTLKPTTGAGLRCLHAPGWWRWADKNEKMGDLPCAFDPVLLKFLLCPLSKKTLRYEALTNELINAELGIAYPIFDGVPNMIPQATRMTHQNKKKKWRRTRSYLKAKT
uniref:Protein preY, mitochondrial n=1 Tax=Ursus americanus TaxID=9643 RepID=A0A452SLV4_URSAM